MHVTDFPILPNRLDRWIDIHGRPIEVGSKVRSFAGPLITSEGTVLGLDTEGFRVSYIEGIIEAIGEVSFEGCPRYSIRVQFEIQTESYGQPPVRRDSPGRHVYPPLNGTLTFGDHATFGVLAI